MESIKSWGVAAALGVAGFVAAMAAIGGFAEGGLVRGGEQIIRVNERGPEFVMPAEHAAIFPILERIRTGAMSAADLATSERGGVARPSTSGAGAASALPGLRGGDPNVSVEGHKMTVLVLGEMTEERIREVMEKHGPEMVVNTARQRRTEIGIPS